MKYCNVDDVSYLLQLVVHWRLCADLTDLSGVWRSNTSQSCIDVEKSLTVSTKGELESYARTWSECKLTKKQMVGDLGTN